MSTTKHAYLIIVHGNFEQLQQLITLLDYPENDIYLHVDKKAQNFNPTSFTTDYSSLYHIPRISVNWGGHSLVKCELNLLKAAIPQHYQYYHLLSGADLPIKTQSQIHEYLDREPHKNYIDFDAVSNASGSAIERVDTYHFFQDKIGRNPSNLSTILYWVEKLLLSVQRKIGIRRKQIIPIYKGSQWFSITDDFARYVLSQEKLIKKQFYHSICADEIFLQSLIMASPYRDTIDTNCLREIDWERGSPYTYQEEDVAMLLKSENLFARKFDCSTGQGAIDQIVTHLNSASISQ